MTTIQDQLGTILRSLGALEAGFEALRHDADLVRRENDTEKERASESRQRMYSRIDEVADQLNKLDGDVRLAVATSAQARDTSAHAAAQLTVHAKKLDEHIETVTPVINKVHRLEWRVGLFLAALTFVGGGIWWIVTSNAGAIWRAFLSLAAPQ